ncbi:MAG: DUF1801 domain-containing protein [Aquiluna sp.]|nr:DUF1801 domain-containing protein [Aquiluna sp.]MCF8545348.1 DUF1801 domain-containing protein [Aquiluna sp.]
MSKNDVDAYLSSVSEDKRLALQDLRERLLALIPGGEESLSYSMPCIKLQGKAVAGYAAWKNHLAYYPHSGSVIPKLSHLLGDKKQTEGGFQFSQDERLSDELLVALVETRLKDIRERYPKLDI